jgi:hypothetical protein
MVLGSFYVRERTQMLSECRPAKGLVDLDDEDEDDDEGGIFGGDEDRGICLANNSSREMRI